jgi:transcriptional regulator GlxA family with amidase domain
MAVTGSMANSDRATIAARRGSVRPSEPPVRPEPEGNDASRLVATCISRFTEPVGRMTRDRAPAGALTRVRDILHARSSEPVTLDELVSAGEYTTKQRLIRSFRTKFGFTPHAYLTHLRLQRARALLERGHSCGETAHAVGFYDQSQLNRHFVKHFGVTPGAYANGGRASRSR